LPSFVWAGDEQYDLRVASEDDARIDSVTRGFLFSDLRGYTSFVERHGAASAVDLLTTYRDLVRGEVDRFDGAEIRTEGDSFYVVFDSVAAAVRCGLAIAMAAAAASSERPEQPINVGIGIHAGETIETSEGYVGSPEQCFTGSNGRTRRPRKLDDQVSVARR
jgi:class 3 adenylate cyclase